MMLPARLAAPNGRAWARVGERKVDVPREFECRSGTGALQVVGRLNHSAIKDGPSTEPWSAAARRRFSHCWRLAAAHRAPHVPETLSGQRTPEGTVAALMRPPCCAIVRRVVCPVRPEARAPASNGSAPDPVRSLFRMVAPELTDRPHASVPVDSGPPDRHRKGCLEAWNRWFCMSGSLSFRVYWCTDAFGLVLKAQSQPSTMQPSSAVRELVRGPGVLQVGWGPAAD